MALPRAVVHHVEGHTSRFDDNGHNVPGETRRASLHKLFPPWTVTREQYAESLSAQRSGISNDVLLFSEVGLTLVHHYRVHSVGRYVLRKISDTAALGLTDENDDSDIGETTQQRRPPGGTHVRPDG